MLRLAVHGTKVYAGGWFEYIAGSSRKYLAELDAVTGAATSWDLSTDALVRAFAVSGNLIYVGGGFSNIAGQSRFSLAALDPATRSVTSWSPPICGGLGGVHSLALGGPTLYVGGAFQCVGSEYGYDGLAAFDTNTGEITPWNPNANDLRYVDLDGSFALAVSGDTVYVGGKFDTVGGQPRLYLAAVDATNGALSPWDPSPDSPGQLYPFVKTLSATGTTLYVGGRFTTISGQDRPYFAQFDAQTPNSSSISGQVADSKGAALSGITVNLTGGASKSTTTGRYGSYIFSGLENGVYTIKPAGGQYDFSPSERKVNINGSDLDGQDFTVTLPTGSLTVTVSPVEAVSAGAQWRMDGGAWHGSGTTVSGLAAGPHTVSFMRIAGWVIPARESAEVVAGQETVVTAEYVPCPVVSITATAGSTMEGGANKGRFTISRTGAASSALIVKYSVGGTGNAGQDYMTLPGTVTIPIGVAAATVDVTPLDDTRAERTETVVVTLSSRPSYAIGSEKDATVSILDNEKPLVSIKPVRPASETGTAGRFRVNRLGSLSDDLAVSYTVGGTATARKDYKALTGSVVIPAGEASALIRVIPRDDDVAEDDETVLITLSVNTAYELGVKTATVTITSDD